MSLSGECDFYKIILIHLICIFLTLVSLQQLSCDGYVTKQSDHCLINGLSDAALPTCIAGLVPSSAIFLCHLGNIPPVAESADIVCE